MLISSISFPDLIKFPSFIMDTTERRVWGEKKLKEDKVTLQIILVFTFNTYMSQNIYAGSLCKCI
jgi:hypothetical protein